MERVGEEKERAKEGLYRERERGKSKKELVFNLEVNHV